MVVIFKAPLQERFKGSTVFGNGVVKQALFRLFFRAVRIRFGQEELFIPVKEGLVKITEAKPLLFLHLQIIQAFEYGPVLFKGAFGKNLFFADQEVSPVSVYGIVLAVGNSLHLLVQ